jgi:hypothetical protein
VSANPCRESGPDVVTMKAYMAHDGETSGSIKTIVDGGTTRHIFGELLVFDRSSLKDVKSTIKLMDQSTTKSSKRGTAVLVNRVQS